MWKAIAAERKEKSSIIIKQKYKDRVCEMAKFPSDDYGKVVLQKVRQIDEKLTLVLVSTNIDALMHICNAHIYIYICDIDGGANTELKRILDAHCHV